MHNHILLGSSPGLPKTFGLFQRLKKELREREWKKENQANLYRPERNKARKEKREKKEK
jgi:hypothetical protein